jgi:hypothetical protein
MNNFLFSNGKKMRELFNCEFYIDFGYILNTAGSETETESADCFHFIVGGRGGTDYESCFAIAS